MQLEYDAVRGGITSLRKKRLDSEMFQWKRRPLGMN